ncbi:hypothetical protein RMSM_00883 [Rhodopirellula maiorica SM1]|uniref:Uncharacterized protein n=1 Tax=Rhodopirellula maiorica SM1 TaxID=1265738 RepID=M5RSB8_9BACT|nr:hypothetical protein RMSM_00883 [Rhodopirellula maiorica SM1]
MKAGGSKPRRPNDISAFACPSFSCLFFLVRCVEVSLSWDRVAIVDGEVWVGLDVSSAYFLRC